ncbi:hypothetical protein H0H87_003208 [Tephrocybe sp. NHM501043]|nr:hypothetical protein H0H87_003208 [Tephrocybe sp. NHM501043]
MKLTSLLAAFSLSFASIVSGAAVLTSRSGKDVFVPEIIEPNSETIWHIGHDERVLWKTDNAPVNISNGASVVLDRVRTLVKGFNLRDGNVTITVPEDVEPGYHTITRKHTHGYNPVHF